ncbi:hypothetical protein F5887DRAFT_1157787 [Amanita rubescens]|nr:hypothetical protein F5887DRAFT_1157787 [Amanita rubescens]
MASPVVPALGSCARPLASVVSASGGATLLITAVHEQAVQQDVTMEDIKCINCRGPHLAISRDCPFFISRFDDKALAALQAKRLKQVRQARDQRHQTKQTARVAARYDGLGLD